MPAVNSRERWSYDEKLAAMKLIDEHEGQVSLAAKELGLHRTTLFKWKSQLWEEYLESKEEVNNHMATVQAKKMVLFGGTEKLTNKSAELFEQSVDYFMKPENFDKLSGKDKVQLMYVILPYVLEKKAVAGVKENTPAQQANFFQSIHNYIKGNGEQSSNIPGNYPTITISE